MNLKKKLCDQLCQALHSIKTNHSESNLIPGAKVYSAHRQYSLRKGREWVMMNDVIEEFSFLNKPQKLNLTKTQLYTQTCLVC